MDASKTSVKKHIWNHLGTTLIEMVVSFALLGIFVSASTVIIFNVTNLYYHVRGENYARQVGDIITGKISAEIEGALYNERNAVMNPYVDTKTYTEASEEGEPHNGNALVLYDETDTGLRMFAQNGVFRMYYFPIRIQDSTGNLSKDLKGTYWEFDKNIYNGYTIESMDFAPADSALNATLAAEYEVAVPDVTEYPGNILVVYMKMTSGQYGSFTVCRYVKLYNVPETAGSINVVEP